ncbi:MAG: NAD-dependent protein deacylase [Eubacteriales bacterium]|nr:NAD-dependent protein deacylase [Eubacteriales bacterium]
MNKELQKIIDQSERIVFLGGAGVSTESGIPDFRSENGIFKAQEEYGAPPETLLSHSYFMRNTERFYAYYKKNLIYPDAKPNKAHFALAKLERMGKLTAVITQNIDDLHQRAGSKKVLELHGSVYRNYCQKCHAFYPADFILKSDGVPHCHCGGVIKPDVVLYEEGLDYQVLSEAIGNICQADTLIIGGTSLVVYPAAGLVNYFRGKNLVVINLSQTSQDEHATLCLHEKVGEALDF